MTREEAINLLKQVNHILVNDDDYWLENTHEPLNTAFSMVIKALEQQTCEDCISRQAAIDAVADLYWMDERLLNFKKEIDATFDKIKALPSVTLQPNTGHWIPCSERLPKKEEKTYWVCTDTEYQCECRWVNNRFGLGEGEWGWSIFDTPQYSKPIAWMPLPEPYKAKMEGEE